MSFGNKKLLVLFSVSLFVLSFVPLFKVRAVSISAVDFPGSVKDESFNVTASISGASLGQNYLRIDLFKEGTGNYFGETFNGSNWYSGGEGKLFFPVTIDSSKLVLATITARFGNPSSLEYPGPGSYKLKIRRYTSSGNQASDNQDAVNIQINFITPSPVPTSTVTPVPTPSASPSPSTPILITPRPTKEHIFESSIGAELEKETLGESSMSSEFEPPKASKEIVMGVKEDNLPKVLIILGLVLIFTCSILFFYRHYKKIKKQYEQ